MKNEISRRNMLKAIAGMGTAASTLMLPSCAMLGRQKPLINNGNINQAIACWGFIENYTVEEIEELCRIASEWGLKGVELLGLYGQGKILYKNWMILRKYHIKDTCHYPYPFPNAFNTGLNNRKYHAMNLAALVQGINDCHDYGFPAVIAFSGLRDGISYEEGVMNCVDALTSKYIIPDFNGKMVLTTDPDGNLIEEGMTSLVKHAEKQKVNILFELLNSKIATDMKGHPDYQADNLRFCMDVINGVNSPRLLLLFDIYHIQIMEGNIIENIRRHIRHIGHFHTAGIPDRNEIGPGQELNYAAIMREIAKLGYKGYVAHEFIPARDPLESLKEAARICDV